MFTRLIKIMIGVNFYFSHIFANKNKVRGQLSKEQEKTWTDLYIEFKNASGKLGTFVIKKQFYHGFYFRYDHKNYELACNGVHGSTDVKIETCALLIRGNVEGRTFDIKKRHEIKEVDTYVHGFGVISLNDTIIPIEEFVKSYLDELAKDYFSFTAIN